MQTFLVLLVVQGEVGDAYFTDPHTHTHEEPSVPQKRMGSNQQIQPSIAGRKCRLSIDRKDTKRKNTAEVHVAYKQHTET